MAFTHVLLAHIATWCLAIVADAEVTFLVDTSYGLAINVAGISPGTPCTITWERADGVGPRVSQHFDIFPFGSVRLFRFTPKKEYVFQVKDAVGNHLGSRERYTCTAGETGVAEYDVDKPFVNFTGRPSFELLVVDHASHLVGFNAEGWIVWFLPSGNGAWDQLPSGFNYDIVTLSGFDTLSGGGFQQLTSTGRNVSSIQVEGLSHEARVDRLTHDVLSIGSEIRNISGLKDPISGSTIVRWNRIERTADVLYNLFDFYDPVVDYGQCSGRNDSSACQKPSFSQAFPPQSGAEDWTHANSVERGTQNNYIMSVRHLSSVVSFHADGSGIQWVLSGEGVKPSKDPSAVVLKYSSAADHQYMQHCARQLANGNVILFDNGDLRKPPFTRFSEYKIDAEKGTANLVWHFEPKLGNATSDSKMFAFHAGSVERLANGNTVGALSCDNSRVGVNCTHAIFEADTAGVEVARAFVPAPGTEGQSMGYRGLPLLTLGGERETASVMAKIIV